MVFAHANVFAGIVLGATLANNDIARYASLTAKNFNA